MGDENHIRTLGDYSKPSYEGYRNTIELPVGNNVVPLRSDTIRLVQNRCSFHGLRSKDPNQHLKDLLKLVDSLDLDGENKERTRLHLTAKLRNDILMFQKHHGESLSEAWTRFKDLLQKVSHHGIDRWFQIQIFYDHVSFHLKCEIDRAAGGKLRNKNTDESWEIIENLAFYDHEGWDETKEFVKPVKAISTPHSVPKTPDRRLLELEDQINFLLKGSRLTPTSSSVRTPQAYVNAVHSKSRPRNQNEPLKLNTFAFRERTGLSPQPQVLETTFEDQIRDYMAAHTDRIERFENAIFKQREGINREEERSNMTKVTPDNTEMPTAAEAGMPIMDAETKNGAENGTENKSIKTPENEETVEAPGSQPITYYLKHKINERLIKGLVNNNRFNNSRSGTRVGKKSGKEYKVLPGGHVYDAILKKKITKKEDIRENFKIPCNIGDLKHVNALVDQGSDVNVMPYSTYMKLNDKRLSRQTFNSHYLSLVNYPLRIVEDVLVEVAEHVYPVDFMILDIKENEKRPFILGTPFLTTAKASIKFDKDTITLRPGKSKVSFHRIPDSSCAIDKGVKNDIEPIAPTMTVNRLVLEWEEKIKLHLEREMKFNQWRSKNFKGNRPTIVATKEGIDDEGEVT
ncbi:zinc finger, CCHC-type containing protein [Tanacetum coccineum]